MSRPCQVVVGVVRREQTNDDSSSLRCRLTETKGIAPLYLNRIVAVNNLEIVSLVASLLLLLQTPEYATIPYLLLVVGGLSPHCLGMANVQ